MFAPTESPHEGFPSHKSSQSVELEGASQLVAQSQTTVAHLSLIRLWQLQFYLAILNMFQ